MMGTFDLMDHSRRGLRVLSWVTSAQRPLICHLPCRQVQYDAASAAPPMHTDDAERPVHFWLLLRGYVYRNETLGFVSIAITFGQPRKDVGSKRDMLHYRANLQCISCSNVIHEAGTSTDAPWLEAETGLDRLDDIGPLLVPVRTFLGARRTAPGGVPHHRPCILRGPLCTACLRVMGTIRRTLFGPNELGRCVH
jgi:hypothetical protein